MKKRSWQRMLSGRRLDLLAPSPLDVHIEDIAHGLSRLSRWNGQTEGTELFSVAQHSLLVESVFSSLNKDTEISWQLAALLHDAAEYVISDLITPFKNVIGDAYKDVEKEIQSCIHMAFRLPSSIPVRIQQQIKRADKICAYYEAVYIAKFSEKEAKQLIYPPRGPTLKLPKDMFTAYSNVQAKRDFRSRFNELFTYE